MDIAKPSTSLFDTADPEVVRAEVWTNEQQLMELARRSIPVLSLFKKPVSFTARPTDVIVVTSPKSGTAWVTHICHQLRTKGAEPDFEEQVPQVVTILEFSIPFCHTDPNAVTQPAEPRLFFTHLSYDLVPKGGKYIFCFRDQKDTLYSFYLFLDTTFSLKGRVSLPNFLTFFNKAQYTANNMRSLLVWWEHRHDDNVLLTFFDDLKEDHAGCVRRIAKFMGFDCDEETIARVVATTTHAEMVKHHSKFDTHSVVFEFAKGMGDEPPTTLIGRVRRNGGRSGEGSENLPLEVQQQIDEEWRTIVTSKTGYRNLKEMREAWKKEVADRCSNTCRRSRL